MPPTMSAEPTRASSRARSGAEPARRSGTAQSWKVGCSGQNTGFGFISSGSEKIFCHRKNIRDGSSLQPGVDVEFLAVKDTRHPDKLMAVDVTGGVCFDHCFRASTGGCRKGERCKFSHLKRVDPSIDEAFEAVAASRLDGTGCRGPVVLINTVDACRAACERFQTEQRSLAIDFEGVDLCRSGELLLAQLATVDGPAVLIDLLALGQSAFDEGGLKALLESEDVLKLVYDGRSDADALHHLHGCGLRHVVDVQILFTLALDEERGVRTELVPGLSRALGACPELAFTHEGKALADLKRAVQALFVPELGGSYDVWKERPMRPALIEYAAADVVHLHCMHAAWGQFCDDVTMVRLGAQRIERVVRAESRTEGKHLTRRDF
jgi:cold shock CspA family protein